MRTFRSTISSTSLTKASAFMRSKEQNPCWPEGVAQTSQSAVPQTSGLQAWWNPGALELAAPCRLEVCDTADRRSALRESDSPLTNAAQRASFYQSWVLWWASSKNIKKNI